MMLINNLFKGMLVYLTTIRDTDADEMPLWQKSSDYLLDTDFAIPKSIESINEFDSSHGQGDRVLSN
jgi:hypothetical protein